MENKIKNSSKFKAYTFQKTMSFLSVFGFSRLHSCPVHPEQRSSLTDTSCHRAKERKHTFRNLYSLGFTWIFTLASLNIPFSCRPEKIWSSAEIFGMIKGFTLQLLKLHFTEVVGVITFIPQRDYWGSVHCFSLMQQTIMVSNYFNIYVEEHTCSFRNIWRTVGNHLSIFTRQIISLANCACDHFEGKYNFNYNVYPCPGWTALHRCGL